RALPATHLDGPDLRTVLVETLRPIPQRIGRNGERDLAGESCSVASARHPRPGKEREVGAGMGIAIGEEEVVRIGRILIDAFLDEPHAEHPDVEVEVFLGVAGDTGDVMDSGNHRSSLSSSPFTLHSPRGPLSGARMIS